MDRTIICSLSLPLAALLACNWPGLASFTGYDPEESSSTGPSPGSTGSTTHAVPTTTDAGPSPSTTTTAPESVSSSLGPGDDSTTAEPVPPPAIIAHMLVPEGVITKPGKLTASISAEHATGVRMQVDNGDFIDMVGGPEEFTAEIPLFSGLLLSNGTHDATFIAWRDGLTSEATIVPFEVALGAPGEGYVWESAPLIGSGLVAAVAALPGDGEAVMVEWGTYYPQGEPRCYLRRRDALGKWDAADFVEVLPGKFCVAKDLAALPDGTLFTLATRQTGNNFWWWLGEIETWANAATPTNAGAGSPGEVGEAVAVGAEKVVVCGQIPAPGPNDKYDGALWFVGEEPLVFDYDHDDFFPHRFDELLRDCTIADGTLFAVGDAHGRHTDEPNQPKRRRRLQLRLDLATGVLAHHVDAEYGAATQSVANAVAVDSAGRVVSGGYLCGDTCMPEATLWAHTPDGTLTASVALGPAIAAPFAVEASPAGYVVVAGARKKDVSWSTFWMSAYVIHDDDPYTPEWIFEKDEGPQLQYAAAAAVGLDGRVYGGGVGASGHPAVVYIHP